MEGTRIGEIIVKELFGEVQPKLEESAESGETLRGTTSFLTSFVVGIIKNKLDAVKNPRELVIVLGGEFEHGMASHLGMLPPEEVDEELDKLLAALRIDIKGQVERVRRHRG